MPGRRISLDTASPECLNLYSTWFSGCLAEHKTCCARSPHLAPLPTRVIDVGPSDGSRDPFLFISKGTTGNWVTLSHCWGQIRPFSTTTATLEANKASIPLALLPALFRDAVTLTRVLGCRYLWIDSICIIQDDPDDWVAESAIMRDVYRNCLLTIAADNARDSTCGIFDSANEGRSSSRYSLALPVRWESRRVDAVIYPLYRDHDSEDFNGPLLGRGWTLQEEALSPRLLRFASTSVRWECLSIVQTEEYLVSANDNQRTPYEIQSLRHICLSQQDFIQYESKHPVVRKFKRSPRHAWTDIIHEYTTRKLTYVADNLPAISGLVKEMGKHLQDNYTAGLWRKNILEDILWYTPGGAERAKVYTAPSWSWASLKLGFVMHNVSVDGTWEDKTWVACVDEVVVVPSGPDPFGRVSSGHLTLTAPIRRVNNTAEPRDYFFGDQSMDSTTGLIVDGQDTTSRDRIICFHDTPAADERGLGPSLDTLAIYVQIGRLTQEEGKWTLVSALVLEPLSREAQHYRRVGYASIPKSLADGWERRTVTIL